MSDELDQKSLAAFGTQAGQLLCTRDFSTLASSFGYALAFGRDTASAIREDLESSLEELGASALAACLTTEPIVSYFKSDGTGLFALVSQQIPAENGANILLELVVSSKGRAKFVTLEQVSAAAQTGVQSDVVNGAA